MHECATCNKDPETALTQKLSLATPQSERGVSAVKRNDGTDVMTAFVLHWTSLLPDIHAWTKDPFKTVIDTQKCK